MWIPVSNLYHWMSDEPLLDWLDLYGEDNGFVRDTALPGYEPHADLGLFTKAKASEFEAEVIELIRQKVIVRDIENATRNTDDAFEATQSLMSEQVDVIYQGLIRCDRLGIFGVPDLIIKGHALAKVFDTLPLDVNPDNYYALDIKFKGLGLNKKGDLSSDHKWEKAQCAMYEAGLAEMLGRDLEPAFIMGRSLSGRAQPETGCFSQVGWVKTTDGKIVDSIVSGLKWITDVKESGQEWQVVPPSDPRLAPNPNNNKDSPWHNVKKEILTNGKVQENSGPKVWPEVFAANQDLWRVPKQLEFFVDFETVNDLNDDFERLPLKNGRALIFMIGCGHVEDGEFIFKVFTAEQESFESELKIIQAWTEYMEEVKAKLAPGTEAPPIYHWYRHEPQELGFASDRHDQPSWLSLPWVDLLAQFWIPQEAGIQGTSNNSLKTIARGLQGFGLTNTVWGESSVGDGTAAMAAAWHCYNMAREDGVHTHSIPDRSGKSLMEQVEEYNLIDCKVMWEILEYARSNH